MLKRCQLKSKEVFSTSKCIQVLLERAQKNNKIKEKIYDEMAAKLFCLEVLDKLLVSGCSSNVPKTTVDAVVDLDKLKNVYRCTVVYNKLKEGIESWKKGKRKSTGCIYLLIVSILVAFLVLCRDLFI